MRLTHVIVLRPQRFACSAGGKGQRKRECQRVCDRTVRGKRGCARSRDSQRLRIHPKVEKLAKSSTDCGGSIAGNVPGESESRAEVEQRWVFEGRADRR